MPHHRAPSGTNSAQNGHPKSKGAQKGPRPVSTAINPLPPNQKPDLGMSQNSRYDHNLKVLRRRDPSITSIFDQFSHVCVYHHNINTNKWEKLGYEGSMFLYERNEYPPYGFYVLNRAGMDDYIQRMQPDDDIGEVGGYVMLRSYPEFTRRRLANILEEHPLDTPPPFDDAYRLSDPAPTKTEKEAESTFKTVGLWVFATDAREPLRDVMYRLHSYVQKNEPYPEEFRYGPGRPPPPNPHLRTTPASPAVSHNTASTIKPSASSNLNNGPTADMSRLLARLDSSASIQQTPSRMNMTMESLFASVGQTPVNGSQPSPPPPPPPTGIALLDTIFASAGPSLQPPSQPEPIIYSPKPSVSALPQILNQDVISTLLGLTSSRSSSTNSFSSSREADCEDHSPASTVFDMETEPDYTGSYSSLGLVPRAAMNGDVTPRAPGSSLSSIPVPPQIDLAPVRAPPVQADLVPLSDTSNGRRLVPFDDADAQLWPYPRAPIDEDEEDIVELDFNDLSALSDTDKFNARSRQRGADDSGSELGRKAGRKATKKKRNAKEREEIEQSWDVPGAAFTPVPVPAPVAITAPASTSVQSPATAKPLVNGKANGFVNGHGHPASGLDPAALKASIINTANPSQPPIEKNEFVREVLTLIHTDKTFVDSLWKDYLSRTS